MTTSLTAVLVHGAGHDADVWRATQAALVHPSVAVDLPGRRSRPADLTAVTIAQAAEAVAEAVIASVEGDVVLVGHSVAGTVLPSVAARLGERTRHLVFVAGVTAPDGQLPLEAFLPGQAEVVEAQLAEARARHGGQTLEAIGVRDASMIDSLNLSSQVMTWAGIPAELGRTFVRCLRDPIQPRDMQDILIASCGATQVLDIDSGHTPALDRPEELARLLDGVLRGVGAARP